MNEQALAAHKARSKKMGPGSEVCLECGDVIPAARREAQPGCELCVDCQQEQDGARG